MGQNFAGWARLKLKAEKGTEIQLRFAEWLAEDDMINPASTGVYATDVVQTDKYICKGDDVIFLRVENEHCLYKIESGDYMFKISGKFNQHK